MQFTEQGYIQYINDAIKDLILADLFESAVETYGLLLPIYTFQRFSLVTILLISAISVFCETSRNYTLQAQCYADLKTLCTSISKETARMFALYYRVVIYAPGFPEMKELNKKEFVYKTPPMMRLAEFKDTLKENFEKKARSLLIDIYQQYLLYQAGVGNVEFLSNVKAIGDRDLMSGKVSLQVRFLFLFFAAHLFIGARW